MKQNHGHMIFRGFFKKKKAKTNLGEWWEWWEGGCLLFSLSKKSTLFYTFPISPQFFVKKHYLSSLFSPPTHTQHFRYTVSGCVCQVKFFFCLFFCAHKAKNKNTEGKTQRVPCSSNSPPPSPPQGFSSCLCVPLPTPPRVDCPFFFYLSFSSCSKPLSPFFSCSRSAFPRYPIQITPLKKKKK